MFGRETEEIVFEWGKRGNGVRARACVHTRR